MRKFGSRLLRTKPARAKGEGGLRRVLRLHDLLFYGVGSTIGGGIYSLIATGALHAGPGMIISFIICAIACALTGFCYAEFVARVPESGSAYSFSYTVFGEFVAWTVGWALTLEYSIASAGTARSFGSYLVDIFESFGVAVPAWVNTWQVGPFTFSPVAAGLVLSLTALLLVGVRFSSWINVGITSLNVGVLLFFVIAGATLVEPGNWNYQDRGFVPDANGVFTAATILFFSYLGFDQVAALAEEATQPRRNLPLGILLSLGIVSVLYVSIALVATGMVPWPQLAATQTPLALCFASHGWRWAAHIVQFGSLFAGMGGVYSGLLGQPRIFFRMAADGLFFPVFCSLNPQTGIPMMGTLIVGGLTAAIAFFSSLAFTASVVSVGILFAFTIVDAGLLLYRYGDARAGPRSRRVLLLILLYIVLVVVASVLLTHDVASISVRSPRVIVALVFYALAFGVILFFQLALRQTVAAGDGFAVPLVPWIPCLGIGINILMACAHLSKWAWVSFAVWFVIGCIIYFAYGMRHSQLEGTEKYSVLDESVVN